jgi:hypothetical protein
MMKIKPAITIRDNQIFNKAGDNVNLRGFTIDNFSAAGETSLNIAEDDFEITFSDIKSRGCSMIRCVVYWDVVEPQEGVFNEEYLAKLRDGIKEAEKNDLLVYLVPRAFSDNKPFWGRNTYPADKIIDEEPAGMYVVRQFTAAMNHLARRIKDCENVIGFAIPECYSELYNSITKTESNSSIKSDLAHMLGVLFITELRKKHPQYYFIAEETDSSNTDIWIKEEHPKYNIISGVFLANNHSMFIC